MIVDSHCHGGRGDGLTGPWDTAAPLGRYLQRADQAGIDRTVLIPSSTLGSDPSLGKREPQMETQGSPGVDG